MIDRRALSGTLSLGARCIATLARIGADRGLEGLGRALPRTPEQLARVETLESLLRQHAPQGATPLPRLRRVALPGVHFESSNCTNFLLEVDFQEEFEDGAGRPPTPSTLYAKLPCAELGTRVFANAVGFWEVEAYFCEHIASRVPVRVPRVYAVARQGARFALLLENLAESPGVRLFDNRDMAAGTTVERSRLFLRSFAELHAAFWGWSGPQREALFPARLHPYLAPQSRERNRALNAAAIEPARRAAPDLFRAEDVALCRLAIEKWDALVEAWYAGPLTLIHGDSHLANGFEYPGPDGPRIGLLDFQGLQWCQGLRDVQYHLINSLEPELLAECEAGLIGDYLGELRGRGIELDPARAREQYRALSFQTLMVAVVSIGLGPLTERSETVRTVLGRSLAAVRRLEFGDWLAQL